MNVSGCLSVVAAAFAGAVLSFFGCFFLCRLIAWWTADANYMWYMWYSMLIVPIAAFVAAAWAGIRLEETRKPKPPTRGFDVIQNQSDDQ